MSEQEIKYKQTLDSDPSTYLELWKYFTDDAGKIKDKMWTITAFFCTMLGGLLAFTGTIIFRIDNVNISNSVDNRSQLLVIAFIG